MIEIKEKDIEIYEWSGKHDSRFEIVLNISDKAREAIQLKKQILQDHKDARSWNYFISNFPNVDFRRLEFVAIKEAGKDTETCRFG